MIDRERLISIMQDDVNGIPARFRDHNYCLRAGEEETIVDYVKSVVAEAADRGTVSEQDFVWVVGIIEILNRDAEHFEDLLNHLYYLVACG